MTVTKMSITVVGGGSRFVSGGLVLVQNVTIKSQGHYDPYCIWVGTVSVQDQRDERDKEPWGLCVEIYSVSGFVGTSRRKVSILSE